MPIKNFFSPADENQPPTYRRIDISLYHYMSIGRWITLRRPITLGRWGIDIYIDIAIYQFYDVADESEFSPSRCWPLDLKNIFFKIAIDKLFRLMYSRPCALK